MHYIEFDSQYWNQLFQAQTKIEGNEDVTKLAISAAGGANTFSDIKKVNKT